MAEHSRDRWGSPVHEAVVGAGAADRLRAHVRAPGSGVSGRVGEGEAGGADVPRCASNAAGLRCGAEFGAKRAVGERAAIDELFDHFLSEAWRMRTQSALLCAAGLLTDHCAALSATTLPRSVVLPVAGSIA